MDDGALGAIRALRKGRAVADLSAWRRYRVTGADAATFLGDLVTGPVETLEPGTATPSFLLSPTGRVRAGFTVARFADGFLLVQDPDQPEPAGRLLAPYVLSSEVEVAEASDGSLAAVVSDVPVPAGLGGQGYAPGALGTGTDLAGVDASVAAEALDLPLVNADAVAAWRILDGPPRPGTDLTGDSLPHEAPGFEEAIDFSKGCYLGQEAVARVRNLGHPPFVLVRVDSHVPMRAGDAVRAGDEPVGTVTSAAADPDGGWKGWARVRWDARGSDLAAP